MIQDSSALHKPEASVLNQTDRKSVQLIGVDFTSTPSKRKAITVAFGRLNPSANHITLERLEALTSWESFVDLLEQPGPWVGAFDFPFGLPRELVVHLQWPQQWTDLMLHLKTLSRSQLRDTFKAFCDARPAGKKFVHRATDSPAGSSSSMKWVNPPVAYMLHEGATRLHTAQVTIPGLYKGRTDAIALEAYPGLIARSITKSSYKNDEKIKQTDARAEQRQAIIQAIQTELYHLEIPLRLNKQLAKQLQEDASGDFLDAALCLLQAGWATKRGPALNWGLPNNVDPLEGWIVSA